MPSAILPPGGLGHSAYSKYGGKQESWHWASFRRCLSRVYPVVSTGFECRRQRRSARAARYDWGTRSVRTTAKPGIVNDGSTS